MSVGAYFGTRIINWPHATPQYGPGKSKFEINYYRQTYFSEKMAHIRGKLEKEGWEVIWYSKYFK